MMECVTCEQLGDCVSKTGNLEVLQSAYKVGHSTQTALLKVKIDILNASNNNEVMCLVLHHLSAAFDMISHQILLNRLKYHFRLDDTVSHQILLNRWKYHFRVDSTVLPNLVGELSCW